MLWQDSVESDRFIVPDTVIDLSFRFECGAGSNTIPIDHGVLLRHQISKILPWILQESNVAIHRIYGAATGNGWMRPEDKNGATMEVSRRTRLVLRIPKERLEHAQLLENRVFQLGSQQIEVGAATVKPLIATRTLFCRSMIGKESENEQVFAQNLLQEIERMRIPITKLLCGKAHQIMVDDGVSIARSVMLAELSQENAVKLQQCGLGKYQLIGCGIFLPHKDIAAIGSTQEDLN